MMKQYFSFIISGLVLISGSVVGQSTGKSPLAPMGIERYVDNRNTPSPELPLSFRGDEIEPVFTNDFSNASDYSITNEGQGTWEIVNTTPADILQYMGAAGMTSTTAANGFGLFNGIQFLLNADPVQPQSSYLTYVGTPIDLSDVDNVSFQFEQRYRAFNTDEVSIEFSIDGGAIWGEAILLNVDEVTNGPTIQTTEILNVPEIANQANVSYRFHWASPNADNFASGYGWMVDDVAIFETPDNDMQLNAAYFDEYALFLEQEEFLDSDYLQHLEYSSYKQGQVRPFNFTAEVENRGVLDQTDVTFVYTVVGPGDYFFTDSTVQSSIISGERMFITSGDIMLPGFDEGGIIGFYTVSFSLYSDAEDNIPGNNVVGNKQFSINDEYMANDRGDAYSAVSPSLGDDLIWATRFMYENETTVDAMQFAVVSDGNTMSSAGDVLYLNMRSGSVFENEGPENVMNRFFDDDELPYTLEEDMFSNSDTVIWITYMLDNPVTVSPGVVYQGEIEIPIVGENYLWIPRIGPQEPFGSGLYQFNDLSTGPQGWYTLTSNPLIRLGASTNVLGIDNPNSLNFGMGQNYPNPTTGQTQFNWELTEDVQNVRLVVTDINGKTVLERNLGNRQAGLQSPVSMDLSNFAPGVYQYGLTIGNQRAVRKLLIAK